MKRTFVGCRPRPSGFTLVELLVVIAIIGVLVALLLPAVQAAREAARRMSCSNNLHQIGIGLHNYHDTHGTFPPAAIWDRYPGLDTVTVPVQGDQRNYSWQALLLPFVEQGPLHSQIDFRRPMWGATPQVTIDGKPIYSIVLPGFLCPSDPGFQQGQNAHDTFGIGWSNYVGTEGYDWWFRGNHGIAGIFQLNTATRIRDIVDGTSNTIAIGEASTSGFDPKPGVPGHLKMGGGIFRKYGDGGNVFRTGLLASSTNGDVTQAYKIPNADNAGLQGFWWRAGPYAMQPTYLHCFGINNNWPGAHSRHRGGMNAAMCDASVKFLSDTMDYGGVNAEANNGWTQGAGVWGALNTFGGNEPNTKID